MGYTVYIHITPNKKRYVGITGQPPQRRWANGSTYRGNKHFYSAIQKYGWDNIKHIIVAQDLSKEEACSKEQALIKRYNSTDPTKGYNNSIGGEGGSTGCKASAETIAKRLAHRDYSTSWAKGKHFSEEHRQRIGESHRGIKHTAEAKEKMRLAHLGKRPAWAGKPRDDKYRANKSKPVICVETQIQYFGLMEAERQTGINHSNISNCLKGKRDKAGGYHWRYAQA